VAMKYYRKEHHEGAIGIIYSGVYPFLSPWCSHSVILSFPRSSVFAHSLMR
jgi:hypothetical protein